MVCNYVALLLQDDQSDADDEPDRRLSDCQYPKGLTRNRESIGWKVID